MRVTGCVNVFCDWMNKRGLYWCTVVANKQRDNRKMHPQTTAELEQHLLEETMKWTACRDRTCESFSKSLQRKESRAPSTGSILFLVYLFLVTPPTEPRLTFFFSTSLPTFFACSFDLLGALVFHIFFLFSFGICSFGTRSHIFHLGEIHCEWAERAREREDGWWDGQTLVQENVVEDPQDVHKHMYTIFLWYFLYFFLVLALKSSFKTNTQLVPSFHPISSICSICSIRWKRIAWFKLPGCGNSFGKIR